MISHIGSGGERRQAGAAGENNSTEIVMAVARVQKIIDEAQEQTPEKTPLERKNAEELTERLNDALKSADIQLKFQLHDRLNEYYAMLINTQTGDVIWEIPSKKLLDIQAGMREFMGLFVDRKI